MPIVRQQRHRTATGVEPSLSALFPLPPNARRSGGSTSAALVECRNTVDRIYTHLPADLPESEVILDFTGMTSIASVGAVLACLNDQRPIQYTPAVFDSALKVLRPRDPIEIVLNWNIVAGLPTVQPPIPP